MIRREHVRVGTRWSALAVAIVLLAAVAAGGAAAVDATPGVQENTTADKAPYYEEPATVDNESWTSGNENASADSIGTYLSRLGTFVIGGDGSDTGAMITGMVLLGAMLGMVVRSNVGLVGGSVLTVAALWGVVGAGLAPHWLLGVAMFGIGLLLSSSLRRVMR